MQAKLTQGKAQGRKTTPVVINKNITYGLEATDNSKAGPAFPLPPESSCDCATDTCWKVCYKRGFTYNNAGSVEKRAKNFRTVEYLLALGGPELLAKALIELIDEHKPKDWFIAKTTGGKTRRPWTFRIHDLGDYPEFRTIPTGTLNDRKAKVVSRIDPPPQV